jgi:hypothetical protein
MTFRISASIRRQPPLGGGEVRRDPCELHVFHSRRDARRLRVRDRGGELLRARRRRAREPLAQLRRARAPRQPDARDDVAQDAAEEDLHRLPRRAGVLEEPAERVGVLPHRAAGGRGTRQRRAEPHADAGDEDESRRGDEEQRAAGPRRHQESGEPLEDAAARASRREAVVVLVEGDAPRAVAREEVHGEDGVVRGAERLVDEERGVRDRDDLALAEGDADREVAAGALDEGRELAGARVARRGRLGEDDRRGPAQRRRARQGVVRDLRVVREPRELRLETERAQERRDVHLECRRRGRSVDDDEPSAARRPVEQVRGLVASDRPRRSEHDERAVGRRVGVRRLGDAERSQPQIVEEQVERAGAAAVVHVGRGARVELARALRAEDRRADDDRDEEDERERRLGERARPHRGVPATLARPSSVATSAANRARSGGRRPNDPGGYASSNAASAACAAASPAASIR